jgi:hypothetical protein
LLEADGVAVRIFDVHLAGAPGLVHGTGVDRDAAGPELPVRSVYIVGMEEGDVAGGAVAGEGREVELDAVALEADVAGVGS